MPKKNPPKVSAEAKEALRLMREEGLSPTKAAKKAGITARQAQRIAKKHGLGARGRARRATAIEYPETLTPAQKREARILEEHYSDLASALGWRYETPDVVA